MLSHADEIKDRLKTLAEDTAGLHTVALFGFVDEDVKRVQRALDRVAAERTWSFLDLRAAPPDQARTKLAAALDRALLVVAALADEAPRALLNLVTATIDGATQVDLGDFQPLERSAQQSLIVVIAGAAGIEQLPRALARVPYMEFVR